MSTVYQKDLAHRIMQLALAFFFLVLGIQEVVSSQQSDLVSGLNSGLNQLMGRSSNPTLELIIGILAILSGVMMLLGVFQMANGPIVFLFTTSIMIYWAARFVFVRFLTEIASGQGALNFYPSLEGWLLNSSRDLIILCALWLVLRGYSRD